MKSSSEDSFGWTNTSSDKSESEAMANEEESDFDKHYKKKLQKELFLINGDLDGSREETPRRKKQKKIKRERDSPAAAVKQESDSEARLSGAAERELRLKAERELAGDTGDTGDSGHARPRKKKKAEREPRDEPDAGEPPPRKKKKHKRETNGIEPIVDKFEAEESVVEARRPPAPPAEKPFTSKEFVDTDSDSDSPPAPRARRHSEKSGVETVTRSPERSPKRALKIRERITYEEESQDGMARESSESVRASGAPGGRLARYVRAHAQLAAARGPAGAGAALTADDDVWLLRAPGSLRGAALAGAALALGARCKLKAGGGAYEAAPAPAAPRAALLLPGAAWRVRGVRVRGALQLRVRVPRTRAEPPAPPPEPRAIALPATTPRHPLLGADYERAHTAPPRDIAHDAHDAHEKKKKKKKEKRKRVRSEAEAGGAGEEARPASPPPRKRARAAAAGGELWDSPAAIEESLFNF